MDPRTGVGMAAGEVVADSSGCGAGGTTVVAGFIADFGDGGNGGGKRSAGVGASIGVFRTPSTNPEMRPGCLRALSTTRGKLLPLVLVLHLLLLGLVCRVAQLLQLAQFQLLTVA